jgi:RNA polymerase sigma-70 factor, ECF subfamily
MPEADQKLCGPTESPQCVVDQFVGDLEAERSRLKGLAMKALRGRPSSKLDVSDVVQSAIMAAVCNKDQYRGTTIEEWWAWLAAIVRNKARNALRFWQRRMRASTREESVMELDRLPNAAERTPSWQLLHGEKREKLLEALNDLPPAEATAIRSRYLDGCDLVQIAQRLGRSRVAAAGVLKRGIKRLKERLVSEGVSGS